jgi:hypothetical protein
VVVARACRKPAPSQYTFALLAQWWCVIVRPLLLAAWPARRWGRGLPESHVVLALYLVGHVGFVSWTSQVIHKGRLTAANFQSGTSPAESECSARHNEQTSIGFERLGCRRIASLAISRKLYGTVENAPGFIQASARPKIVSGPFPP